jgi:serine/threonine-protein kinase
VARFEREARVLASLNHPHIAAIYGLEESDGRKFLVMELAAGETLAQRIARGPIPVAEALAIVTQIAEALEAAHEKGVVHRDLKPANIKVTPDGQVKVLDFGLAKALESARPNPNLPNSPTLSMAATNAGMILGTAAYMSPERGQGPRSRRAQRRVLVWMRSSLTKWSRITLGRSASSKWHSTASRTIARNSSSVSASVKIGADKAFASKPPSAES